MYIYIKLVVQKSYREGVKCQSKLGTEKITALQETTDTTVNVALNMLT